MWYSYEGLGLGGLIFTNVTFVYKGESKSGERGSSRQELKPLSENQWKSIIWPQMTNRNFISPPLTPKRQPSYHMTTLDEPVKRYFNVYEYSSKSFKIN